MPTSPPRAPEDVLARVAAAALGERQQARRLLADLWAEVGDGGDPLHRVAVAHATADVQDDPREELAWDTRALQAAESVTDERAASAGVVGPVAAFLPSLHLNLGDDQLRLGDLPAARRHLELGRAAAGALSDDGYGALVRRGLDGLAARIAAA